MSAKKNELEYNPKTCWEIYSSLKHRKAMDDMAGRYVDFLTACKTERETVRWVLEKVEAAGLTPDFHSRACFRVLHEKAIFLARKGERPLSDGVRIIGGPCGYSPTGFQAAPPLRGMRGRPCQDPLLRRIRKHQWLARELALHGVVVKTSGEVVEVVIGEDPEDPVLTIADLLPHLAHKQVLKKVSEAFEAEKLNVILGHEPLREKDGKKDNGKNVKFQVLKLLNDRYGIVEEDLYSAELQAVPAGPARFVGLDRALIGGYGQDDRSCVFTGLEAFLAEEKPEYCQVVLFYDKEEIGSEGSTSARSLFFEYCMDELIDAWEPGAKPSRVFLNSTALSADVHAPVDPDYQELHDKLNSSYLGYGPTFCKFTGHRGKVGANDAHAEYVGWLRSILKKAKVPWQMAGLGKVDGGGGGTVAKFLAEYCMNVIDFGPPVLSMHSPFELSSKADIYATVQAFRVFLKS